MLTELLWFVLSMRQLLPVSLTIKLSHSSISHSPTMNSIISLHLFLTPGTMILDIGKHTFNYPWPHISLKYSECTAPQGDTLHDLSPNLFMCRLLGRDLLLLCLQYVYILLLNHERPYLWCLQQDVVVRLRSSPVKMFLASVVEMYQLWVSSTLTQEHTVVFRCLL